MELLRRPLGDLIEFVTVMRFDSLDAVRVSAGPDYEVPVVPPKARALLERFDQRSAHYEVRQARGAA
jgi:hypothetical protein